MPHTRLWAALCGTLCAASGALYAQTSQENQDRARIEALEQQVDALIASVENRDSGTSRTTIGGYGELHYNNLSEDDGEKIDQMDFHRFVLFIEHQFSDRLRFVSELELEHSISGEGQPGEVELEQAYIEIDHGTNASTQAGLFLIPVGIINETHEPPTFYGVERNDVESIIIPSTWWEGGAQHLRRFGSGWQWNIALHSGLKVPTDSFRVRSGRQKVGEADASSLAYTTRIKYSGIPGFEWAASLQVQKDPSQLEGDGLDDGRLLETHIVYNRNRFSLRALYANWDFSGIEVENSGTDADQQSGWYVEPSYKITDQFGIYARLSSVDAARPQDKFEQSEIGFNWWLHNHVVFKFDWRQRDHDLASEAENRDFDGFDLGVGYHF